MEEFGYSERCTFILQDSYLCTSRARKTGVGLWKTATELQARDLGSEAGSGYDHGPQFQNKGTEHNWFQEPKGQNSKRVER